MAETLFFRQGDGFMLGQDNPAQRYKTLPPATYLLKVDLMRGFYLELAPDFELPKKLYGDLSKKAEKILTTFKSRPATTGVLLEGEKGSGKTLLTKLISTYGRRDGIPTILVNFSARGDSFSTFLQQIEQPVILLFDEFEKAYDGDEQLELLTLFDGVFSSKKLFLLTSNSWNKIDDHMKNRPGRIYYALNFDGLDPKFIMEYAEDNLKNKAHVQNLGVLVGFIKPMNFDMLKAVVEESNRYDQPPMETLDMLNVRVVGYIDYFDSILTVPGKILSPSQPYGADGLRCNPLNNLEVGYHFITKTRNRKTEKETDKLEYGKESFAPSELVSMDGIKGIYEYKKADGATLKLTRKPLERSGISQVSHLAPDAY